MLALLEKFARLYSTITLFILEFLIQTGSSIILGSRSSFIALKNTLRDSFYNLLSDIMMLLIDLIQSLVEGLHNGWNKAKEVAKDFWLMQKSI